MSVFCTAPSSSKQIKTTQLNVRLCFIHTGPPLPHTEQMRLYRPLTVPEHILHLCFIIKGLLLFISPCRHSNTSLAFSLPFQQGGPHSPHSWCSTSRTAQHPRMCTQQRLQEFPPSRCTPQVSCHPNFMNITVC